MPGIHFAMNPAFDPTSSPLGISLVYLLVGAGILVLLGTLGVQIRGLGRALRSRDRTPLLLGTAAPSLGLASIVGAALAVELGGPGALPWMWVVTFLGMGLSWASVTAAARSRGRGQGHDHRIQASPIRSMRTGLGGVGVALGIAYAITIAIAAAAIGALLHGQQIGALFVGLAGAKAPVIAGLLALLAAPLILSPGTSAGPPLRRLSLRLLPVFLLIYIAVTLALLLGDLDATAAALTTAISSAFSSKAAIGGASGGALAALTHAVLRTMMSGPGLGVAAFAPEIAETDNIETAGARAMLGPLLGAGVIGSL
ncbi:MAG TPA: sodium:alanine symporter family protein, partial [Nannocystis exedens]|nr:sodium:alanine symporter family protein [Nannocystis exedens]